MKKIFIGVCFFILSVGTHVFGAEEIILYSENGFEIKSSSVIDTEGYLSVVKNSELFVSFHDEKADFELSEPSVSFGIKKFNGENVLLLNSPDTKMTGDNPGLSKYLLENKDYFEHVMIDTKSVYAKTQIDFESGEYIVFMDLDIDGEQKRVEYKFTISKSAFGFSDFDIILEDSNFLANIGYTSFADVQEEHTIIVSLIKFNNEIFRKEIKKVFYEEGSILIDEKIPQLEDLDGKVSFKIEIKDSKNETIFEKVQELDLEKSSNLYQYIYYVIIALLLLLIFFIFKKVKSNKIKIPTVAILLLFVGLSVTRVYAVETCGGVAKPADYCIENKVVTWVCKNTYTCSVEDARLKKYFSTGKIFDLSSPTASPGPVSVSVNVCTDISHTLNTGNDFYVISDSEGSSWQRKKFHVFRFTKGTSKTITFDPGGDKRNVNYATYNGNCTVTVSGKYEGQSSNYRVAKTKIVEVGKITSSLCRSTVINEDVFNIPSGLFAEPICTQGELRDTYIAGGVYFTPVYDAVDPWKDKTVDICGYLGYGGVVPAGKTFYALMDQTSSWTMIEHPIFKFVFGTPSVAYSKELNGNTNSTVYYYSAYKENVPVMTYDGGCKVTFRLWNYGAGTSSWTPGYKLIEVGLIEDATCRDEHIVKTSTATIDGAYTYATNGLDNGQVELVTKRDGGRYSKIAPFIRSLSDCVGTSQCNPTGTWIRSYTNTPCGEVACTDTSHVEGDSAGCSVNNLEQKWTCTNNTWGKTETDELCTTLDCSVSPDSIPVGGSVTYTATPILNATYKWFKGSSPQDEEEIPGQTSTTYTTNFDVEMGFYNRMVKAKNGSTEQVKNCPVVNVKCAEEKPNNIACVGTTGFSTTYNQTCDSDGYYSFSTSSCSTVLPPTNSGSSTVDVFEFVPSVTNGTTCPLHLIANNAVSCRLKKRLGTYETLTKTSGQPGEFYIKGDRSMPIGVYSVECNASSTAPRWDKLSTPQSCSSNPESRDN